MYERGLEDGFWVWSDALEFCIVTSHFSRLKFYFCNFIYFPRLIFQASSGRGTWQKSRIEPIAIQGPQIWPCVCERTSRRLDKLSILQFLQVQCIPYGLDPCRTALCSMSFCRVVHFITPSWRMLLAILGYSSAGTTAPAGSACSSITSSR